MKIGHVLKLPLASPEAMGARWMPRKQEFKAWDGMRADGQGDFCK